MGRALRTNPEFRNPQPQIQKEKADPGQSGNADSKRAAENYLGTLVNHVPHLGSQGFSEFRLRFRGHRGGSSMEAQNVPVWVGPEMFLLHTPSILHSFNITSFPQTYTLGECGNEP